MECNLRYTLRENAIAVMPARSTKSSEDSPVTNCPKNGPNVNNELIGTTRVTTKVERSATPQAAMATFGNLFVSSMPDVECRTAQNENANIRRKNVNSIGTGSISSSVCIKAGTRSFPADNVERNDATTRAMPISEMICTPRIRPALSAPENTITKKIISDEMPEIKSML